MLGELAGGRVGGPDARPMARSSSSESELGTNERGLRLMLLVLLLEQRERIELLVDALPTYDIDHQASQPTYDIDHQAGQREAAEGSS